MLKTDNRKLILSTVLLFLSILVSYKIPHRSYSLAEALLEPLEGEHYTFYTSGILPFLLFLASISLFFSLKRNINRSKFFLIFLILIAIIPFMRWSLDMSRSIFYVITGAKLEALDLVSSEVKTIETNEKLETTFHLEISDYSWNKKEFKIRIYLTEELSKLLGTDLYESDITYKSHGFRQKLYIDEVITLPTKNDLYQSSLTYANWSSKGIVYELYHEDDSVKIIG